MLWNILNRIKNLPNTSLDVDLRKNNNFWNSPKKNLHLDQLDKKGKVGSPILNFMRFRVEISELILGWRLARSFAAPYNVYHREVASLYWWFTTHRLFLPLSNSIMPGVSRAALSTRFKSRVWRGRDRTHNLPRPKQTPYPADALSLPAKFSCQSLPFRFESRI